VLQGNANGVAVYVETQTATTNGNGLVSIKIGTGTATTGTFAGINWAAGTYFIKTETDPAGGSNYTITGTQEILSVPYAMYAAKSGDATTMGAIGGSSTANGGTITAGVLSLTPANATNGGIVTTGAQTFAGNKIFNDNVGIGTATPPAKLSVLAGPSQPSIPGTSSTGVFRIGVRPNEGMDFGKSNTAPYSGWIQNGFANFSEPLSLNPLGGNVGIGTMTPAESAQLDVSSSTKGFLPPRMTAAQRNAIVSPAPGLMLYCTNCGANGEPEYFNGTAWVNITGGAAAAVYTPTIGSAYQGGIVAYILVSGDPGYDASVLHGIIAAPSDQSTGIQWYNGSYVTTGATGTAIGTGNANTNTIVSVQGAGSYAAKLCSDLSLNGRTDWYLPSKDELNKLYINKALVGGFADDSYWSSAEFASGAAWVQFFGNGLQFDDGKIRTYYVRAVRGF
jgi:hypothetical protein